MWSWSFRHNLQLSWTMFESYVTPILLYYAQRFISNLKAGDLRLSIGGGDVILKNVELRKDVFVRELGLPIVLERGIVRELRLHVPWTALTSKPIEVTLNAVDIRAVPIHASVQQDPLFTPKGSSTTPTAFTPLEQPVAWVKSLWNRLIHNVKISVTNLVLKYMDGKMVANLSLERLNWNAVDKEWNPAFVDPEGPQGTLRKALTLHHATVDVNERGMPEMEPLLRRMVISLHILEHLHGEEGGISLRMDLVIGVGVVVQLSDRHIVLVRRLLTNIQQRKAPLVRSISPLRLDDGEEEEGGWFTWAMGIVEDFAMEPVPERLEPVFPTSSTKKVVGHRQQIALHIPSSTIVLFHEERKRTVALLHVVGLGVSIEQRDGEMVECQLWIRRIHLVSPNSHRVLFRCGARGAMQASSAEEQSLLMDTLFSEHSAPRSVKKDAMPHARRKLFVDKEKEEDTDSMDGSDSIQPASPVQADAVRGTVRWLRKEGASRRMHVVVRLASTELVYRSSTLRALQVMLQRASQPLNPTPLPVDPIVPKDPMKELTLAWKESPPPLLDVEWSTMDVLMPATSNSNLLLHVEGGHCRTYPAERPDTSVWGATPLSSSWVPWVFHVLHIQWTDISLQIVGGGEIVPLTPHPVSLQMEMRQCLLPSWTLDHVAAAPVSTAKSMAVQHPVQWHVSFALPTLELRWKGGWQCMMEQVGCTVARTRNGEQHVGMVIGSLHLLQGPQSWLTMSQQRPWLWCRALLPSHPSLQQPRYFYGACKKLVGVVNPQLFTLTSSSSSSSASEDRGWMHRLACVVKETRCEWSMEPWTLFLTLGDTQCTPEKPLMIPTQAVVVNLPSWTLNEHWKWSCAPTTLVACSVRGAPIPNPFVEEQEPFSVEPVVDAPAMQLSMQWTRDVGLIVNLSSDRWSLVGSHRTMDMLSAVTPQRRAPPSPQIMEVVDESGSVASSSWMSPSVTESEIVPVSFRLHVVCEQGCRCVWMEAGHPPEALMLSLGGLEYDSNDALECTFVHLSHLQVHSGVDQVPLRTEQHMHVVRQFESCRWMSLSLGRDVLQCPASGATGLAIRYQHKSPCNITIAPLEAVAWMPAIAFIQSWIPSSTKSTKPSPPWQGTLSLGHVECWLPCSYSSNIVIVELNHLQAELEEEHGGGQGTLQVSSGVRNVASEWEEKGNVLYERNPIQRIPLMKVVACAAHWAPTSRNGRLAWDAVQCTMNASQLQDVLHAIPSFPPSSSSEVGSLTSWRWSLTCPGVSVIMEEYRLEMGALRYSPTEMTLASLCVLQGDTSLLGFQTVEGPVMYGVCEQQWSIVVTPVHLSLSTALVHAVMEWNQKKSSPKNPKAKSPTPYTIQVQGLDVALQGQTCTLSSTVKQVFVTHQEVALSGLSLKSDENVVIPACDMIVQDGYVRATQVVTRCGKEHVDEWKSLWEEIHVPSDKEKEQSSVKDWLRLGQWVVVWMDGALEMGTVHVDGLVLQSNLEAQGTVSVYVTDPLQSAWVSCAGPVGMVVSMDNSIHLRTTSPLHLWLDQSLLGAMNKPPCMVQNQLSQAIHIRPTTSTTPIMVEAGQQESLYWPWLEDSSRYRVVLSINGVEWSQPVALGPLLTTRCSCSWKDQEWVLRIAVDEKWGVHVSTLYAVHSHVPWLIHIDGCPVEQSVMYILSNTQQDPFAVIDATPVQWNITKLLGDRARLEYVHDEQGCMCVHVWPLVIVRNWTTLDLELHVTSKVMSMMTVRVDQDAPVHASVKACPGPRECSWTTFGSAHGRLLVRSTSVWADPSIPLDSEKVHHVQMDTKHQLIQLIVRVTQDRSILLVDIGTPVMLECTLPYTIAFARLPPGSKEVEAGSGQVVQVQGVLPHSWLWLSPDASGMDCVRIGVEEHGVWEWSALLEYPLPAERLLGWETTPAWGKPLYQPTTLLHSSGCYRLQLITMSHGLGTWMQVAPFVVVCNNTEHKLSIAAGGQTEVVDVAPHSKLPWVRFAMQEKEPWMALRISLRHHAEVEPVIVWDNHRWEWSVPVSLALESTECVVLPDLEGNGQLLECTVTHDHQGIRMDIDLVPHPPVLIRNQSEEAVRAYGHWLLNPGKQTACLPPKDGNVMCTLGKETYTVHVHQAGQQGPVVVQHGTCSSIVVLIGPAAPPTLSSALAVHLEMETIAVHFRVGGCVLDTTMDGVHMEWNKKDQHHTFHWEVQHAQVDHRLEGIRLDFPVVLQVTGDATPALSMDLSWWITTSPKMVVDQLDIACHAPLELFVEDALLQSIQQLHPSSSSETKKNNLCIHHVSVAPVSIVATLHATLGVYVGVQRAPFALPAVHLHGVFCSSGKAIQSLMHTWEAQMGRTWPLMSVLGSWELLGDLGGVLREVGSGVRDAVVLPVRAVRQGSGGLLSGLGQGASALVRGVGAAALSSVAGVTSSAARNIARLVPEGGEPGKVGIAGSLRWLLEQPGRGMAAAGLPGLMAGLGWTAVGMLTMPIGGTLETVARGANEAMHRTGWRTHPTPRWTAWAVQSIPTWGALQDRMGRDGIVACVEAVCVMVGAHRRRVEGGVGRCTVVVTSSDVHMLALDSSKDDVISMHSIVHIERERGVVWITTRGMAHRMPALWCMQVVNSGGVDSVLLEGHIHRYL